MVRVPMKYVTVLPNGISMLPPEPPHPAVVDCRLSIEASRKRKRIEASPVRESKIQKTAMFPLLSLPLELRLKIYDEYFQLDHSRPKCDLSCPEPCHYHKRGYCCILYVSKQVYADVWPIYTRYQCFTFRQFMILTEDFLRVLPIPQLHRVRHLAIHNGLDYGHRRFIGGLLKTWWKYVDVFSRLETLTFEAVTNGGWKPCRIPHFYKLVQVLIQLLEQGTSHRSLRNSKCQSSVSSARNALDVPESHPWALHFGGIGLLGRAGCLVEQYIAYHKIVVQRHTADFAKPPDMRRGRIEQMRRELVARNGSDQVFHSTCASYCHLDAIDNASRQYSVSAVSGDFCEVYAKFKLGKNTRLVNDLSVPCNLPGYSCAQVVTIVGQWKNEYEGR